MNTKFYIGPMSKNIVDSIIEFCNTTNNKIGLIPSRRQIDFDSGYVNNWKTDVFAEYVKSKTFNIILQRDHGGPNQGTIEDDGNMSFYQDCKSLDMIHIDPWKMTKSIETGCELTVDYIRKCYSINPSVKYEIGTEQAIFPYSHEDLNFIIQYANNNLEPAQYANIVYAVIQSGTSLKENVNAGVYDQKKLLAMVNVCKTHKLLSKEHNGDYLPIELIHEKFVNGLDSINIAPEFGQIETKIYLDETKKLKLFDIFYEICYFSNKWKKWVDSSFNPHENKEKLINICGHYVLSDPVFLNNIKYKLRSNIDVIIKTHVTEKLKKLYSIK